MTVLRRVALGGALLLAVSPQGAGAFNPHPRPAPGGGTAATVCADDRPSPATRTTRRRARRAPASSTPTALVPNVAVRGTLTLITDEDVTGWDDGADASARPLVERAATRCCSSTSTTARSGPSPRPTTSTTRTAAAAAAAAGRGPVGTGGGGGTGTGGGAATSSSRSACRRRRLEPAGSEGCITDPQLNIVYSIPGAQIAKAVAVDLTGNANTTAKPFLDIVDRLPGDDLEPHREPTRSRPCSSSRSRSGCCREGGRRAQASEPRAGGGSLAAALAGALAGSAAARAAEPPEPVALAPGANGVAVARGRARARSTSTPTRSP